MINKININKINEFFFTGRVGGTGLTGRYLITILNYKIKIFIDSYIDCYKLQTFIYTNFKI